MCRLEGLNIYLHVRSDLKLKAATINAWRFSPDCGCRPFVSLPLAFSFPHPFPSTSFVHFKSFPRPAFEIVLIAFYIKARTLGLRIKFRFLCNLLNLYLITNESCTTYPRTVRSGGRKIIQIACGWWRREFKLIFELARWVRWVLHWRMCYIAKISQSSLSCPLLSQS